MLYLICRGQSYFISAFSIAIIKTQPGLNFFKLFLQMLQGIEIKTEYWPEKSCFPLFIFGKYLHPKKGCQNIKHWSCERIRSCKQSLRDVMLKIVPKGVGELFRKISVKDILFSKVGFTNITKIRKVWQFIMHNYNNWDFCKNIFDRPNVNSI